MGHVKIECRCICGLSWVRVPIITCFSKQAHQYLFQMYYLKFITTPFLSMAWATPKLDENMYFDFRESTAYNLLFFKQAHRYLLRLYDLKFIKAPFCKLGSCQNLMWIYFLAFMRVPLIITCFSKQAHQYLFYVMIILFEVYKSTIVR